MNVTFLGDALDFWKGCLFSRLRAKALLNNLVVEPLLTDSQNWHPHHLALYAELLRVDGQVIHHQDQHALANDREAYLNETPQHGDLFLDPDTGVRTHGVSAPLVRYVTPCEVAHFAQPPNRVVALYQHVRGMNVYDRAAAVISELKEADPALHSCSIESATVAMLFASHDATRIAGIYADVLDWLPERTHLWPAAP